MQLLPGFVLFVMGTLVMVLLRTHTTISFFVMEGCLGDGLGPQILPEFTKTKHARCAKS